MVSRRNLSGYLLKVISLTFLRVGPDGPWATSNLAVGAPVQVFQGIPGINSAALILPREAQYPVLDRTPFFSGNSASWVLDGLYDVPLPYYITQGLGAGVWGQDVVYLGNSARDVPSDVYVVLVTNPEYVSGSFGLSAGLLAQSGYERPTLLSSHREQAGTIPSLSFGYTAGSKQLKYFFVAPSRNSVS